MASSIQLLRSTIAQERPFPGNLLEGQPAVNINASEPGLFFKAADGSLVKFGPAAITSDGSPPNSSSQGSAGNTIGELWLDKSTDPAVLKVYDGTNWIDAGSGGGGTGSFVRWIYTAIGGETSLSGSSGGILLKYTPGLEEVFINGILITRGTDYSAVNGSSITNLTALTAGDVVTVTSMNPLETVQLPGQVTLLRWSISASSGQTVLTGVDSSSQQLAYTAGFEEVYVNGAFLRRGVDYVATDGTTIVMSSPLALDDEVTVLAWSPFSVGELSVGTADLEDEAVTSAKLGDEAVTSAKLGDEAVTNAKVNPAAGIESSKLSFTYGSSSSGARTVKQKLEDVISPKDFGAVGNGSDDDTSSLAEALNAANGKTLDLGGGNYKITSAIAVNYSSDVKITNGKITCDFPTQIEYGVRLSANSTQITLDRVEVDGGDTCAKALWIRSLAQTVRVFVSNCYFHNVLQISGTGLAAALLVSPNFADIATDEFERVSIVDCTFKNVFSTGGSLVGRGLYLQECAKALVTGCYFENIGPVNDGDGVFASSFPKYDEREFIISDCTFLNCQKRAIKSQVAKTRASNIITQRTQFFAPAGGGVCEIDLQSGGVLDGFTHYVSDGCAAPTIVSALLRSNEEYFQVRNVNIVAENPLNILGSIVSIFAYEDIEPKNTIIDGISGNCRMDYFCEINGRGLTGGTKSTFQWDGVHFSNIRFPGGFNPTPATDPTSGQKKTAFIFDTRNATAYVQSRITATDVHIGSDNTVQTAYLNTSSGSLIYVGTRLMRQINCTGFDLKSYNGTGLGTFTAFTEFQTLQKKRDITTISVGSGGGQVSSSVLLGNWDKAVVLVKNTSGGVQNLTLEGLSSVGSGFELLLVHDTSAPGFTLLPPSAGTWTLTNWPGTVMASSAFSTARVVKVDDSTLLYLPN